MKTYRPSSPSRHRDRAALERRRLTAAKLFKKGVPQAVIARRFKVTPAAVNKWYHIWAENRKDGLLSKGRSGPKPKLTESSLKKISALLVRGPQKAGYGTDLWTLERIRAVIRKKTGLSFGTTHIWRILTIQIGWSSQKPETRAKERDEQAITEWKRTVWPRIKRGQEKWEPASVFGTNRG